MGLVTVALSRGQGIVLAATTLVAAAVLWAIGNDTAAPTGDERRTASGSTTLDAHTMTGGRRGNPAPLATDEGNPGQGSLTGTAGKPTALPGAAAPQGISEYRPAAPAHSIFSDAKARSERLLQDLDAVAGSPTASGIEALTRQLADIQATHDLQSLVVAVAITSNLKRETLESLAKALGDAKDSTRVAELIAKSHESGGVDARQRLAVLASRNAAATYLLSRPEFEVIENTEQASRLGARLGGAENRTSVDAIEMAVRLSRINPEVASTVGIAMAKSLVHDDTVQAMIRFLLDRPANDEVGRAIALAALSHAPSESARAAAGKFAAEANRP